MEADSFKLKLKITSTQQELEVTFRKDMSLEELKKECSKVLGENVEVKLILRGKILKTDEDLALLKEGQTLYLVKELKKTVEAPMPVPISSGAGEMTGLLHGLNHFGVMNQATSMLNELDSLQNDGDLGLGMDPNQMAMVSQMMSNPATRDFMINSMQQMLSNPQMRQMMINSNPALRRLAESNPGVLDMMSNPVVLEQMKGVMQRMALGGGAGPLSGDASSFPAPGGGTQATQSIPNPASQNTANNPFANPFANPIFQQLSGMLNPSQGGFPGPSPFAPNPSSQSPPSNTGVPNPQGNPSTTEPNNLVTPPPQSPPVSNPFNPTNPLNPTNPTNPPQNPIGGLPNQGTPPMNPFANPFMGLFNPMLGFGQNPYNPYMQAPNPYSMPQNYNFQNPFYNSFMPPPPQAAPAQNPRELYASQLQSMKEMGFINEEANIKALQATRGDVQAAIERIINMLS